MSLSAGKRDLAPLIEVLNGEHETVEAAAKAAWEVCEEIFASRAKFVVVGQLAHSPEHGRLDPSDPLAVKVGLGWYATEATARDAAERLAVSAVSGDTFATWVLDSFHGTAADWHKGRKEHYAGLAEKRAEKDRERQRKDIEKRDAELAERARQFVWGCTCGHDRSSHSSDKPNRCVSFGCPCTTYVPIKEDA